MELFTYTALAFVVAIAVAFFLGWKIGGQVKTGDANKDIQRNEALRENAQVDFEFVRSKADEIVRLANEIAKRATTAQETVLIRHADIEEVPTLPDGSQILQA